MIIWQIKRESNVIYTDGNVHGYKKCDININSSSCVLNDIPAK